MTTQMYVGKVVRKPVVRPKVIFTSVELEDGNTMQAVVFPNRVSYEVKQTFSNASIDDTVKFVGTKETNKYNGEEQIVVSSIQGADTNERVDSGVSQTVTIFKDEFQFTDKWGREWKANYPLPDSF